MLEWAVCTGTNWTVVAALWGFAGKRQTLTGKMRGRHSACCTLLYHALETSYVS